MQISDINLDGENDDYELFAKAMSSRKLKSLLFRGVPFTDSIAFKMLCEALPYSGIENLRLETSGFNYYQLDLSLLINVLPYVPSLKQLELQGQTQLNKLELISVLDHTEIRYLGLRSVELNDQEATQLAQKIPFSKLKLLNVQYNLLSRNGETALLAAKNAKPGFTVWI